MSNSLRLWIRGAIVDAPVAVIPALSPSAQYGLTVFESVRCYLDTRAEKLLCVRFAEHLRRLFDSMTIMRLESKYTREQIQAAFLEAVQANAFREDIIVRLACFVDGQGSWSTHGPCELMIAPKPMGRVYSSGVSACVSSWERISDRCMAPRAKIGANYINGRMAHLDAAAGGYDTAIQINHNGTVAETPGACLFMLRNGELVTPPVTSSVLESITRGMMIELAEEQHGLRVVQREIDRTELYVCDELFLVGTAVEIAPVTSVDGVVVGEGTIGAMTAELSATYFNVVRGRVARYRKWLTDIDIVSV